MDSIIMADNKQFQDPVHRYGPRAASIVRHVAEQCRSSNIRGEWRIGKISRTCRFRRSTIWFLNNSLRWLRPAPDAAF